MNTQPLASVVINNYNYGRFLRDAIESSLNQTYKGIEVLVVDDGSTDNSRAIIESYGSRVVPVFKSNGGQASAFNAALAKTRGEIVCLLDSDDSWLPRKVEEIMAVAEREPETVLFYHRLQPVSEDCRPSGKCFPEGLFHDAIAKRLTRSGGLWACPATSALCFRRNVLEAIGPIPESEFRICADAYLTYLVPFLGPVTGLEDCLALYRIHGSNHFSNAPGTDNRHKNGFAQREVGRFTALLDSVNRRLTEMKCAETLCLDDHLAYQIWRYRASLPGHLRRDQLAWRALVTAGEPVVSKRIKYSMKILMKG